MILKVTFWVLLLLVVYCYVGYPILLGLLVLLKRIGHKKSIQPQSANMPDVTILIAAYNEEKVIDAKMQNIEGLNYPREKLHVLWITDGPTDSTNSKLAQYPNIELICQPQRMGKAAALNRAMENVTTPFTVFCDAGTMLSKNSVLELITSFTSNDVGCVVGEIRVLKNASKGATTTVEGTYWQYESTVKRFESELGSTLCAAGALYAIRTDLYSKIPENSILDDFEISIHVALQKHKVVYNQKAEAYSNAGVNFAEEMKRKIRIAAGGFQTLGWHSDLLNIFKFPLLSFKFISHKLLRWIVVPFCIFLLPIINLLIVIFQNTPFYFITLVLMLVVFLLTLLGYLLRNKNIKPHSFYLPYYALMMNIAQIKGLIRFCTNKQDVRWEKAKREEI